jgi:hypothetical protein
MPSEWATPPFPHGRPAAGPRMKTMTDIVVSAHGGRWSDQLKDFKVPPGSTVKFYVDDGGILPNDLGYSILDALLTDDAAAFPAIETVEAGEPTYDYACWFAPDFAEDCGLYLVGRPVLYASLSACGESNPLPLSYVVERYPNRVIHWVACREVTGRDEDRVLTNASESFLNAT